tara:strand:+ start:134 stop:454 length:321 start_codon:yes stop_codon:yes gene_type:complete
MPKRHLSDITNDTNAEREKKYKDIFKSVYDEESNTYRMLNKVMMGTNKSLIIAVIMSIIYSHTNYEGGEDLIRLIIDIHYDEYYEKTPFLILIDTFLDFYKYFNKK